MNGTRIHRPSSLLTILDRFFLSSIIIKLGGAGDRFCDYLCLDFANLPCPSGHNQRIQTKFTRPITNISKSTHNLVLPASPFGRSTRCRRCTAARGACPSPGPCPTRPRRRRSLASGRALPRGPLRSPLHHPLPHPRPRRLPRHRHRLRPRRPRLQSRWAGLRSAKQDIKLTDHNFESIKLSQFTSTHLR